METILIKTLQFLLSLGLLVFVHEFGHFMWAKIFKVRVEKFYLFFDAGNFALWRWKPKGSDTEYGIGWLPLGGYCKISGMIDESLDKDQMKSEPQPWEFRSKKPFPRFMIIIGGVLNNIIAAMLIYIGMTWYWGTEDVRLREFNEGMVYSEYAQSLGLQNGDILWSIDGEEATYNNYRSNLLLGNELTVKRDGEFVNIALPDSLGEYFLKDNSQVATFAAFRYPMVVSQVTEGGNAAAAGMAVGDSIVAINNVVTPYSNDVAAAFKAYAGDTIMISYYRAGALMQTPVLLSEEGKVGIGYGEGLSNYLNKHVISINYSFLEAIPVGVERCYNSLYNYIRQFKLVFTKEGAKSVGGFVAIGNIFPEQWQWLAFWSMTAFLSVALAFMNILPIPALDGGHLLFIIIEVITRRKPSDKVLEYAQYVGMFLIIALMILANVNDIYKFIIQPMLG